MGEGRGGAELAAWHPDRTGDAARSPSPNPPPSRRAFKCDCPPPQAGEGRGGGWRRASPRRPPSPGSEPSPHPPTAPPWAPPSPASTGGFVVNVADRLAARGNH